MRILFLTHRLPYAPNRGDRIRAFYLMRAMSRFADVSLFSFVHDRDEAARANEVPFASDVTVRQVSRRRNLLRAAASLPGQRPLTHLLLDAPGTVRTIETLARRIAPDVVVAFCSGMARFTTGAPLGDRPSVLDMVDVDSAKWSALAGEATPLRRLVFTREADRLRRFERRAAMHARATLVVNAREAAVLRGIAPDARIEVVENGIDVEAFTPRKATVRAPAVIFCGVMDYAPNAQGVEWFVRQVWPSVRAARPDARFVVVGPRPAKRLRALAETQGGVDVLGAVPETQPHLWNAAVSVAPLHVARGLQNKVLEAVAAGLPVVVTSAVAAGLPAALGPACAAADEPQAFAQHVVRLLNERAGAAPAPLGIALDNLTWDRRMAPVEGLMRAAIGRN